MDHFEKRLTAMDGKAMIVAMSRRICVALYKEIVALRPDWHREPDEESVIKVVMTGSASDLADWQPHIRNKKRREALADATQTVLEQAEALSALWAAALGGGDFLEPGTPTTRL